MGIKWSQIILELKMKVRPLTKVVTKASEEAFKDGKCAFCGFSVTNQNAHNRTVHGIKSNEEAKEILADQIRLSKWRSENGYTEITGQCGLCLKQCTKYTIKRCINKCKKGGKKSVESKSTTEFKSEQQQRPEDRSPVLISPMPPKKKLRRFRPIFRELTNHDDSSELEESVDSLPELESADETGLSSDSE